MSLDIEQYSLILERWRRAELVDRLILEQRRASMRASLVVNPVTRQPYAFTVNDSDGVRSAG